MGQSTSQESTTFKSLENQISYSGSMSSYSKSKSSAETLSNFEYNPSLYQPKPQIHSAVPQTGWRTNTLVEKPVQNVTQIPSTNNLAFSQLPIKSNTFDKPSKSEIPLPKAQLQKPIRNRAIKSRVVSFNDLTSSNQKISKDRSNTLTFSQKKESKSTHRKMNPPKSKVNRVQIQKEDDEYTKKWKKVVDYEKISSETNERKLINTSPILQLIKTSRATPIESLPNLKTLQADSIINLEVISDIKLKVNETIRIYGIIDETGSPGKNNFFIEGIIKKSGIFPIISISRIQNKYSDEILKGPSVLIRYPTLDTLKIYNNILNYLTPTLKAPNQYQSSLIDFMLQFDPRHINKTEPIKVIKFFNQDLDVKQRNVVVDSLNTDLLYAIEGPQSIGRSTIINEIISQLAFHGKKVLVVSQEETSTLEIMDSCKKSGVESIHIGKINNLKPEFKSYSLDDLLINQRNTDCFRAHAESLEKNGVKKLVRLTRNEIISNYQLLFSKMDISSFEQFNDSKDFDYVIIDDCTLSLEALAWIPLLRGKKIILAGDCTKIPENVSIKNNILMRIFAKLPDHMRTSLPREHREDSFENIVVMNSRGSKRMNFMIDGQKKIPQNREAKDRRHRGAESKNIA